MTARAMNIIKNIALATILIASTAQQAAGQNAGTVARMGFGARGIGLGNAMAADLSGHASPFYNPALAPYVTAQNLEASVALMSFDRQMQFLQFSAPMRPRAGIAAGLIHAGVGNIDGRDANGYHTQDYSTNEYALFLAFGTRITERITAGLGLQVFRADYFETLRAVNSIGIDIGLAARLTDDLHLGLVIDDLLARYSWDTSAMYGTGGRSTSDRFPRRIRVGGSYNVAPQAIRLLVEYEARFTSRETRWNVVTLFGGEPVEGIESERLTLDGGFFRAGIEWTPREAFAVRAGVDRMGQDGFTSARPSAGFMIEQPVGTLLVRAEYGMVMEPYDAGLAHLISLRVFL